MLANGLDGAGEALRILVNEASRIERAQHLQATPYERSAQRVDYANGYKTKGRPDPHGRGHLRGAASALWWLLSQRPGAWQPLPEQAMNLALAEMYVQGVSTRLRLEVLQKLVGPEVSISSTQISRCTALLDTGWQAWRSRPLGDTPYVILNARY